MKLELKVYYLKLQATKKKLITSKSYQILGEGIQQWVRRNFKYYHILIFYFGVPIDRYKIDKLTTRDINIKNYRDNFQK